MTPVTISFEDGEIGLDWLALIRAMEAGHLLPKAHLKDVFLYRGEDTLLNRSAWVDGLGLAVKCATVFPGNRAKKRPVIHGGVSLFDDETGDLRAILDFHLVTKWKTAGDSILAASKLARPDSQNILIVGAGTVGRSLWQAYSALFPGAQFKIWNRSEDGAKQFAQDCPGVGVADDLETAVAASDIITCATMSTSPVIKGVWLRPGQHLDLIGAYRPDMREADDDALRRSRIFVDARDTTLAHIGELKIPLEQNVITTSNVIADYYDGATFSRKTDGEITLFKNGGGAHLDLMTSRYILDCWRSRQS